MSESVLNKKFEYWQNQLLDLGKRNKMINYRETKRTTLRLIEPSFEEMFQRVAVDEEELTFQNPLDRNSDIRTYSILSLLENLSCPIPVSIGDIKTDGSILDRQKTLKHLRSKSRLAFDEQGINILYMVSGFVEWREKNTPSSAWVKSPLVLVPVTLTISSINAPYVLKKSEDEVVVNPTLSYLFERDYGITLPSFDTDEKSITAFMDEMEAIVDKRGWRVIRENSIGLVSFLKINMYNDLCNNEEEVKNNKIIRAFAGEKGTIPDELYEFGHDKLPSAENFQVLSADSSQQDAILLSQKGVSFVMQGPPGTGKSQTITNIIAQGLADGKRILFVSEKAAALEVVYKRLKEVQLDNFCLTLHNYKANKKIVVEELGKSLKAAAIRVKSEDIAKLTELDTLKEYLKQYVTALHTEKKPLEMTIYEVYGALANLEGAEDLSLNINDVTKLTKDQINRLGLLVVDFDRAKSRLGNEWYKNPWNGVIVPNVSYDLTNKIKDNFSKIVYIMNNIITALEVLQFYKGTNNSLALNDIRDYVNLLDSLKNCVNVPAEWLGNDKYIDCISSKTENLKNMQTIANECSEQLSSIFNGYFFANNADEKSLKISNLMNKIGKTLFIEKNEMPWSQYVQTINDIDKELENSFGLLCRILAEVKIFCDKWGLEQPVTIKAVYKKYYLAGLLSDEIYVQKDWFDLEADIVIPQVEEYEAFRQKVEDESLTLSQICSLKILEDIDFDKEKRIIESTVNNSSFAGIREFTIANAEEFIEIYGQNNAELEKTYSEAINCILNIANHCLEVPKTLFDCQRYTEIFKMLTRNIMPGKSWYDKTEDKQFEEKYTFCIEKQQRYNHIHHNILESWDKEIFTFDARKLLQRMRSSYVSVYNYFKNENGEKAPEGIILKTISEYEAVQEEIKNKKTSLAKIFNTQTFTADISSSITALLGIDIQRKDLRELQTYSLEKMRGYVDLCDRLYADVEKAYKEMENVVSELSSDNIGIPSAYTEYGKYVQIIKTLLRDILPAESWSNKAEEMNFDEQYKACIEKQMQYKEIRKKVTENWDETIFDIDFKNILSRFRNSSSGIFKFFKKSYREDKKFLRGKYRGVNANALEDSEIISVLEELEKLDGLKKWFSDNDDALKKVFGGKYNSADTDFETICEDRKIYTECYYTDGVGAKLLLYLNKYNPDKKAYYLISIDLAEKLIDLLSDKKFAFPKGITAISEILAYKQNELQQLKVILGTCDSLKQLIIQPNDFLVADYINTAKQINVYTGVICKKDNIEKTLIKYIGAENVVDFNALSVFKEGLLILEDVKRTVKQYQRSSSNTYDDVAIIHIIDLLSEYQDIAIWYDDNNKLLRNLFGGKFKLLDTDFDVIKGDKEAYRKCCSIDGVGDKLSFYISIYDPSEKAKYFTAVLLLEKLTKLLGGKENIDETMQSSSFKEIFASKQNEERELRDILAACKYLRDFLVVSNEPSIYRYAEIFDIVEKHRADISKKNYDGR